MFNSLLVKAKEYKEKWESTSVSTTDCNRLNPYMSNNNIAQEMIGFIEELINILNFNNVERKKILLIKAKEYKEKWRNTKICSCATDSSRISFGYENIPEVMFNFMDDIINWFKKV